MPYRQLLQLTVDIPWFLNLKIPVRFITTFSDYEVNQSVLPVFEVALDSVLEETDFGERWRRRRGLRCPEAMRSADSVPVRCNSETGYVHAGPGAAGGRRPTSIPACSSFRWPRSGGLYDALVGTQDVRRLPVVEAIAKVTRLRARRRRFFRL